MTPRMRKTDVTPEFVIELLDDTKEKLLSNEPYSWEDLEKLYVNLSCVVDCERCSVFQLTEAKKYKLQLKGLLEKMPKEAVAA